MQNYHSDLIDCPNCSVTVLSHRGELYTPVRGRHLTGPYETGRATIGRHHEKSLSLKRVFLVHHCNSGDVAAHKQLRAKVLAQLLEEAAAIKERTPRANSNVLRDARGYVVRNSSDLRKAIYEHALTRTCPKCSADLGELCENLTQRRQAVTAGRLTDPPVHTVAPHAERLEPVQFADVPELAKLQERVQRGQDTLRQIEQALKGETAVARLIQTVEAMDRAAAHYSANH